MTDHRLVLRTNRILIQHAFSTTDWCSKYVVYLYEISISRAADWCLLKTYCAYEHFRRMGMTLQTSKDVPRPCGYMREIMHATSNVAT